jgi:hypothetical protein
MRGARRTSFNGNPGVVHMTPDVGEDLGLEPELADRLTVCARLFGSSGRGELDVVNTKRIQCLGNGDLGLGVEECIGELLALCETYSASARLVNLDDIYLVVCSR